MCFSLFLSYVNESSGMTTLVTYKRQEPAYVDQVSNILIESVTRVIICTPISKNKQASKLILLINYYLKMNSQLLLT